MLKNEGMLGGALVLGPLRPIQDVWPEEIKEWSDFHGLTYCVLHGPKKDFNVQHRYDIYLLNFEGLKWLIDKGHLKTLLKRGWITRLVVDELSKLKHTDTQRFKLLKPYLGAFASRWGLTGSPAANGLMNLFGQVYVLDGGAAFGPYITYWRAAHFSPTGTATVQYRTPGGAMASKVVQIGWTLKPGAEQLIYAKLRPLVLRMDADDYLDLPKILPHVHKVKLPPAARKIYKQMEDDLVVQLEAGLITAANTATAIGKCRQIASGALYHHAFDPITGLPTKGGYSVIHDAKLDALEDLLEELQGTPIFCAYEWQHDIERIVARLAPEEVPYIGGGVSAKKLTDYKDRWNRNELPWLFGQPQSVAHGLNFQKGNAAHVGFFTLPWDFETYDQFIRRVRRQGNSSKWLHLHHWVVEDTVDEDVAFALKRKEKGQRALFDALKARLLSRVHS